MENEKEYCSCNIIEHGFDAQVNSINLCCRTSQKNDTEKLVLIPNYDGKKIDLNNFFEIKNKLRNIQKSGETITQCKDCIYLETKNWTNENYISSININNWVKCNAKCIYCNRKFFNQTKEYKIFPLIKDLIKNNYLKPPYDITIAGGEPTISKDFDNLIDLLIKNNISPVRVLTNSIKYNKKIELGLKKGLVNILVSTDSGTKDTYKKVKLVDKHSDVWKNIKKYASIQKEDSLVKTKFIFLPNINTNKEEIKFFIEQNLKANIKYVYFDVEISWFYRYLTNKDFTNKLLELFDYAKNLGEENNINILPFDKMHMITKENSK
jgi:wyosine [tRNA(Phe)-imidazoG37] synthetase (radical SAM superfamily)